MSADQEGMQIVMAKQEERERQQELARAQARDRLLKIIDTDDLTRHERRLVDTAVREAKKEIIDALICAGVI